METFSEGAILEFAKLKSRPKVLPTKAWGAFSRGSILQTNLAKPCNEFVKCPINIPLVSPRHRVCTNEKEFRFREKMDLEKNIIISREHFPFLQYSPNSQTQLL